MTEKNCRNCEYGSKPFFNKDVCNERIITCFIRHNTTWKFKSIKGKSDYCPDWKPTQHREPTGTPRPGREG